MMCTHSHVFKLLSDVRICSSYIEENMSLEYCKHSSLFCLFSACQLFTIYWDEASNLQCKQLHGVLGLYMVM